MQPIPARCKTIVRAQPARHSRVLAAPVHGERNARPILLTAHNLTYYQRLLAAAREAIVADRFSDFVAEKLKGWTGGDPAT